jgi:hypothetical protein
MISIIVFEHGGVCGAAPAAQALGITDSMHKQSRTPVLLWPGARAPSGRALTMGTGFGSVEVLCGQVSLMQVSRATLATLNPCLRGALAELPHVVGVLWLKDEPCWLVDMSRFPRVGT